MNIEFDQQVGKNLRRIRRRRKFTQEQIAAKLQVRGCDITRSALAKIEAGQRHVYADELFHLREILSCDYEELIGRP